MRVYFFGNGPAHYGFDAVHDDWKSQFIGGCSAPIQISEVITTATTADNSGELLSTSGDIKGKGFHLIKVLSLLILVNMVLLLVFYLLFLRLIISLLWLMFLI